jgi:hypothetical protein
MEKPWNQSCRNGNYRFEFDFFQKSQKVLWHGKQNPERALVWPYSRHSAFQARTIKRYDKELKARERNFVLPHEGKIEKEQKDVNLSNCFFELSDIQQKILKAKDEFYWQFGKEEPFCIKPERRKWSLNGFLIAKIFWAQSLCLFWNGLEKNFFRWELDERWYLKMKIYKVKINNLFFN